MRVPVERPSLCGVVSSSLMSHTASADEKKWAMSDEVGAVDSWMTTLPTRRDSKVQSFLEPILKDVESWESVVTLWRATWLRGASNRDECSYLHPVLSSVFRGVKGSIETDQTL